MRQNLKALDRRSGRAAMCATLFTGMALIIAAPPVQAEGREPLRVAMMDDMGKSGMGGMGGQQSEAAPMGGMPGSPMGGMPSGQMGSGQPGSSGSPMAGMGMMNMMRMMEMMKMMGMAPGAPSGMPTPSALPGFPGASHLYHVGATGFYLDYADKLGLTVEQRTALNDLKQRALLDQSGSQRKTEESEQALWTLTAAEQPDTAAVEGKIREIEKVKADQRLAFIRAVGEAAKVLTPEQRKAVLGMASMPAAAPAKPMTK